MSFPESGFSEGGKKVAITSHREVPDRSVEVSFVPRATFLQDGLYGRVLSRTTSLFSSMKETPRNIRGRAKISPLDASVAYCVDREVASETIKRYAMEYRRRYDLIGELVPDS